MKEPAIPKPRIAVLITGKRGRTVGCPGGIDFAFISVQGNVRTCGHYHDVDQCEERRVRAYVPAGDARAEDPACPFHQASIAGKGRAFYEI